MGNAPPQVADFQLLGLCFGLAQLDFGGTRQRSIFRLRQENQPIGPVVPEEAQVFAERFACLLVFCVDLQHCTF